MFRLKAERPARADVTREGLNESADAIGDAIAYLLASLPADSSLVNPANSQSVDSGRRAVISKEARTRRDLDCKPADAGGWRPRPLRQGKRHAPTVSDIRSDPVDGPPNEKRRIFRRLWLTDLVIAAETATTGSVPDGKGARHTAGGRAGSLHRGARSLLYGYGRDLS